MALIMALNQCYCFHVDLDRHVRTFSHELSANAEVERRITNSTNPMADSETTCSSRFLFLLNNDYGELGLAMYFLQGRELINASTLLMPPRLYAKNKDNLPVKTCEYESIEDIIRTVDSTKPDIVFLFSGYILPLHEVISPEGMTGLLQLLSDRGVKVATSDPFFGIFSRMDPADISGPKALGLFETELVPDQTWPYRLSMTFGNIQILKQFTTASQILNDTIHLYYTCTDPQDDPIEVENTNFTFFNPSLISAPSAKRASGENLPQSYLPDGSDDPHWLFIIGSVDYELQTSFYGESEFIDMLVEKLHQTLEAGRRPVFLAPNECVQELASRAPISARKDLLTFCAYPQFSSLLLQAEYVFYWNLASYSTFLRVINGLPMFMFDDGHLSRHVKPMHERLVRWYYQNWKPPYLNQHDALTTGALEDLSKDYKRDTDRIVENLKKLPSPEHVIDDLLRL